MHNQQLPVTRIINSNMHYPGDQPLNPTTGCVVWLTGLSGSGKTTLAHALQQTLRAQGIAGCILDGDQLRDGLCADLGFSAYDRNRQLQRTTEVAKLLVANNLIAIVALISPYQEDRAWARERIGNQHFIEVYVSTPLSFCEQRDTKGLYRRARSGDLLNFTGISSPYEVPTEPDLILDTSQLPKATCIALLTKSLKIKFGFSLT